MRIIYALIQIVLMAMAVCFRKNGVALIAIYFAVLIISVIAFARWEE